MIDSSWSRLPSLPDKYGLPFGYFIITQGELAGRICFADDHEFVTASEMTRSELKKYQECGVQFFKYSADEVNEIVQVIGEQLRPEDCWGLPVEIVLFGELASCGSQRVPRDWLKPATVQDLIDRRNEIFHRVFRLNRYSPNKSQLQETVDLLFEKELIGSAMEQKMMSSELLAGKDKDIFLCHASSDKGEVRKVYDDLAQLGAKPWLDEFEIVPGQSIVDAIEKAQGSCQCLLLFWSRAAMESPWVKREWNSAMSRSLTENGPIIIPVVLEECDLPALLHDILHVRLYENYNRGLEKIVAGIERA